MDRDQIMTTLRERILAFATSRISRDHAEDLTQETMAVLHEKYPQIAELTELIPLAFQILRYKMLDAHRKTLRRGEYNQESVEDLPLADAG
jgi:RNA polymerase sigma-70 factor (ECF subfamily)